MGTTKEEINYPEHKKLQRVKDQSQCQGEFLEWLYSEGYAFCKLDKLDNIYIPVHKSVTSLLAEYHGIDEDKLEKEKQQMLETLRAEHEST